MLPAEPEGKKLTINMQIDDPQKASILGLNKQAKVNNPFYHANELDRTGRHKDAERIYLDLLNGDFDNPILHAALGMCYAGMERNGLGSVLLRRALDNIDGMLDGFKRLGITPKGDKSSDLKTFFQIKRSEILNALGTCYKHENKVAEARALFYQSQENLPMNPDIQNNLATLYINEGKPEKALEHLDLALSIQPGHPQASWNKSLAHLELGDYSKGWALYDAGFDAHVRAERNYSSVNLPKWDGSPGKNVVVYGEQGIGDEILFASCLPDLIAKCNTVVFDCHKKLHTLFAQSFPDIDIYPTREDDMLTWPVKNDNTPRYKFDAKVAVGSLPKFFRQDLASFPGTPFLTVNATAAVEWENKLAKLSSRPKIGISWIGGHKRTRVEVRSTPLETLLPILQQDADFISLQYTPCTEEIADFKAKHGITIHQFPEAIDSTSYADTAALLVNLDLVITVCTSVVHLAGSLGVPTWVLTPSRPAWRYRLDLDTMPWYGDTITLFRQQPDSTDWTPVIEEVSTNLADLLKSIQHG